MNCLTCQFETNNPKFCSRSCAAKHNNKLYPKRSLENICKICESAIATSRSYCNKCWSGGSGINNFKIKLWLSGQWDGGSKRSLSDVVRNFLLKEAEYKCSKCGFDKNHPTDNKTILEINHIDGDGTNHDRSNLEVICPNCHALTDTYRGRNYKRGTRAYSYYRVSNHRAP